MLMQTFMSATDLGIPEVEKDALIKVLGMLERGEIDAEHFNMKKLLQQKECGTVGCLCGWAHLVSEGKAFPELSGILLGTTDNTCELGPRLPPDLRKLFWIGWGIYIKPILSQRATPDKAAQVLRTYLATGKNTWTEVLAL